MEAKNKEELENLLKRLRGDELSAREIYRAVQAFGENGFREARPEVEQLLTNEDPELRFVALKVLTCYWNLMEHWETARQVLEHDPDADCRFRAASALECLKRNTQDEKTLRVLAQVVRNSHENQVVREAAYAAMRGIIQFDPREQFNIATRGFNLERDADWKLVERYL